MSEVKRFSQQFSDYGIIENPFGDYCLFSELSASQAREAELEKRLDEAIATANKNCDIAERFEDKWHEAGNQLNECKQRAEAAEARIKASQGQGHCGWAMSYQEVIDGIVENGGVVFSDTCDAPDNNGAWFKVYTQPPIQPELAELQRENAELKESLRTTAEKSAERMVENTELRKLLEESKAVPEGWQLVPKTPTFNMCAVDCDFEVFIGIDTAKQVYEAMLAAAPQPQERKE